MAVEGIVETRGEKGVDLTNCDREAIHIPGKIQPHGVLVGLEPGSLRVACVSENVGEWFGVSGREVLGKGLEGVFGEARAGQVLRALEGVGVGETGVGGVGLGRDPVFLCTMEVGESWGGKGRGEGGASHGVGQQFHVLAHQWKGMLLIELEWAVRPEGGEQRRAWAGHAGGVTFQSLLGRVRSSLGRLEGAGSVEELCDVAAEEVRRLTGYGRVMIYKFDEGWHGRVVAESLGGKGGEGGKEMESYLGHQFPASDIPRQARELYRLNRIRLIADTDYRPVNLMGLDGGEIDLSFSVLRSVSPIHVEYLRNMEVGSSMSVSIIREGRLWGLIACHHRGALFVPYDIRSACEHLGEIVALQLSAKEYTEDSEYRIRLTAVQNRLLGRMTAHESFVKGLTQEPGDLLGLTGASGAAVLMDGMFEMVGQTPGKEEILRIVEFLQDRPEQEVFATDSLPEQIPGSERIKDVASGVLAVSVPRFEASYIIWFRPEVVRTVTWAGNPNKPVEEGERRISPRKSFEAWKEDVRLRSYAWKRVELEAAAGLRDAVIGIVLKKAEELQRLNADLQRSNKELEAFSYSVSHDLRAPFRHIVGYSNLLKKREGERLDPTSRRYVETIAESARYAGALVDSLLAFSQMGRKSLSVGQVSLKEMVGDVVREVSEAEGQGRGLSWVVGELPVVTADPGMLRLAVRNLLSNAVKYTRGRETARVEVKSWDDAERDEWVVCVKDNGVGFDMAYADKLFGVFQRLHRAEEFEGTGIGLANVRRIIERHGGRTWATAQKDEGATFYFTLPKTAPKER